MSERLEALKGQGGLALGGDEWGCTADGRVAGEGGGGGPSTVSNPRWPWAASLLPQPPNPHPPALPDPL